MLYNTLFFCSLGWHRRLDMKAGGMGLPFYRLVPVLRNEAVTAEQNAQLVWQGGDYESRIRRYKKLLESYGSCMMKMLSQLQNY